MTRAPPPPFLTRHNKFPPISLILSLFTRFLLAIESRQRSSFLFYPNLSRRFVENWNGEGEGTNRTMDGSHDGGNDRVSRERGPRYAYRVHPPILLLVLLSLSLSLTSHHARARSAPFFPFLPLFSNRSDNRYIRRIISDYAPLCSRVLNTSVLFFAMDGTLGDSLIEEEERRVSYIRASRTCSAFPPDPCL